MKLTYLTLSTTSHPLSSCVRQYRAWEKVNRPWDSQLIVGISANPHVNDNDQGLRAGMNAFFPKPLTIKTIADLQCCSEALQRTRLLDAYERKGRPANATVDETKGVTAPGSESDVKSLSESI
jgi:PleD family two-component response regulator